MTNSRKIGTGYGQAIFIAGMHRSGTSLVAQAFYRAGLFLGSDLLGPSRPNPEGFFEDRKVIGFHDKVLRDNGAKWHSFAVSDVKLSVSSRDLSEASQLIEKDFKGHEIWGWKDPRGTLFLDLWNEVMPGAKFIFSFRKAEEVVWSLIRRGDFQFYSGRTIRRAIFALRLWTFYNRQIIKFVEENPHSSLIMETPGDLFRPDIRRRIKKIMEDDWKIHLKDLDARMAETYKPELMRQEVPLWINVLSRAYLPAAAVGWKLKRLHERLLTGTRSFEPNSGSDR